MVPEHQARVRSAVASDQTAFLPRTSMALSMVIRNGQASIEVDKLKDVLDVERELARVREEIDRYEGRLRYLRAHAALSTLTIYVHEPVPVVGRAGSSLIGEAFKQAWRNIVSLVAMCISSLGIVLPLGVLATAGALAANRWRKGRPLRAADA
jgi:hypothetical protein